MKKINIMVLVLLISCLLGGCKSSRSAQQTDAAARAADTMADQTTFVYYLNKDETKVVGEKYQVDSEDTRECLQEYIKALRQAPTDTSLKRNLGVDTKIMKYGIKGNQLLLNFSADYINLSQTTEVLFRAAIVRTMCQVPGIDSISFLVEGEPLTDSAGNPIGNMTSDMFIDNTGNEINAYERTSLTLYFANADGSKLVEEKQDVVYSSNISMEKLVMEKLIAGPQDENLLPTLSKERKVTSITVKDGICYVTLSSIKIDAVGKTSEEVSFYSIVNSLVELKNINKVEVLIEGDADGYFRENIKLDKVYERNLDILESSGK